MSDTQNTQQNKASTISKIWMKKVGAEKGESIAGLYLRQGNGNYFLSSTKTKEDIVIPAGTQFTIDLSKVLEG